MGSRAGTISNRCGEVLQYRLGMLSAFREEVEPEIRLLLSVYLLYSFPAANLQLNVSRPNFILKATDLGTPQSSSS